MPERKKESRDGAAKSSVVRQPSVKNHTEIQLIAIEIKGAFGNEGALPLFCEIVLARFDEKGTVS